MLVAIGVTLTTWLCLSFLAFMFCSLSFRETATHPGTFLIMMLFGWIPAAIVCGDIDELKN